MSTSKPLTEEYGLEGTALDRLARAPVVATLDWAGYRRQAATPKRSPGDAEQRALPLITSMPAGVGGCAECQVATLRLSRSAHLDG